MIVLSVLAEDEAREKLVEMSNPGRFRFWRRPGNLRYVERFFLPYYFYRIRFQSSEGSSEKTVALDGLLGEMMFFVSDKLKLVESLNDDLCPFLIPQEEAVQKLNDNVRWLRMESSLRQKTSVSQREILKADPVYYPYWIGYLKRHGRLDFKALDAVSGEFQTVRMRRIFLKAFRFLDHK